MYLDYGPPDHVYARRTGWAQADTRWRVTVIDTTALRQEQTLDKVTAWVKVERATTPLLSCETRWWEA